MEKRLNLRLGIRGNALVAKPAQKFSHAMQILNHFTVYKLENICIAWLNFWASFATVMYLLMPASIIYIIFTLMSKFMLKKSYSLAPRLSGSISKQW